jgi:XTP/dITP diphosphohydrolase/tetrapyrrole methylase family protein/MazG family protein
MPEKIYDCSFIPDVATVEAFVDFVAIVRQLRRDCPWDREQTHESVKHLLIEETYEAVEAIDERNWTDLKKELGDLLLHVVFHAAIAEGDARFVLREVIESESEKLIRRHPHVFGDATVQGVADVLTNWESIKQREGGRKSVLAGVPSHLPGLLRAYRMQEKAAAVGFDFPTPAEAWKKVEEELHEFGATLGAAGDLNAREDELGDLLFALVNFARLSGLQPENALRRTNAKFQGRVQFIEQKLAETGRSMGESDLETLDRYWDEAKAAEASR